MTDPTLAGPRVSSSCYVDLPGLRRIVLPGWLRLCETTGPSCSKPTYPRRAPPSAVPSLLTQWWSPPPLCCTFWCCRSWLGVPLLPVSVLPLMIMPGSQRLRQGMLIYSKMHDINYSYVILLMPLVFFCSDRSNVPSTCQFFFWKSSWQN